MGRLGNSDAHCSVPTMAIPNASVTCIWKIKNFRSCTNTLIKHGELKRSFKTIIEPCGASKEWILELSSEKTKFYRLVLKQFCWKVTQCECELSILANDGKNLRYHKVLNTDEFSSIFCTCADYTVPISEIYGDKRDIFLPQYTLTVRCRIWQLGLFSDQWFFSTTIHSESYLWSIKQFSNTQKVTRKKFKLASFEFEVELHRAELSVQSWTRETFVITEIRKGNYSGICNLCLTVNNCKSKVSEVCVISSFYKDFVNISDILSEHYLENDTLPLKWTFTAPVDESPSEAAEAVPTPISQMSATPAPYRETIRVPPNTLQERMLHLYQGGKFSDATLSVGDVWFPIHKGILCSRSPVFCAMLEGDNRESRTGKHNLTLELGGILIA